MGKETEGSAEIESDGIVILNRHFLTDERIIKRLLSKEDFEIVVPSIIIIDTSAPSEQQKDHFSTSESLSDEPTGGIKSTIPTGSPSEATILAIRQAGFWTEKGEAPIAIVDQTTDKGLQKAWYQLADRHNFKPGDQILVTPVTKHYYGGGECETYQLAPR